MSMRRADILSWSVVVSLWGGGCVSPEAPDASATASEDSVGHLMPTQHAPSDEARFDDASSSLGAVHPDTVVTGNGMNYHGGPVLKGPVAIYDILYGSWVNGGPRSSDNGGTINLIETWIGNPTTGNDNDRWEKINSTYGDNTGNVLGHATLTKDAFDNFSAGTTLSTNNNSLQGVVARAINTGGLPLNANAVYFVLATSEVTATTGTAAYCSQFCGFHAHTTINGVDIKYAFIGNPDRCPSACEPQFPVSPNQNPAADAMVNVMAHELVESISDPDLNAWFDSAGQENADKCVFKYGPVQFDASGAKYNQTITGTAIGLHWLIQMNWENSRGGGCSQQLGGPFFTN